MRAPLVFEAKDLNGNALPNAAVTVRDRITGSLVTLYGSETSFISDRNPTIADGSGRVVVWAERGDYTATITGTGITPYSMPIDATPAADASVDPSWMTAFPYRATYNAAAETITDTTYRTMPTPDVITDVTIPANSVIGIGAMFMSKATTLANALAGIFVNGLQLRQPQGAGAPAAAGISSAGNTGTANTYSLSVLAGAGWQFTLTSVDYVVENTTGMTYSTSGGGSPSQAGMMWCWVPDAGIYDFSLQFQAAGSAQTLFVKERRLWVWVLG